MMLRSLPALAALLAASPLAASPPPAVATSTSGTIVISVVVYGNDRCPQAVADEIIVCARKPEAERYRIPAELRQHMVVAGPPSWSARVATIEAEGRKSLPGSCSPIGSYGQTGCARAKIEQWQRERREMQRAEALP